MTDGRLPTIEEELEDSSDVSLSRSSSLADEGYEADIESIVLSLVSTATESLEQGIRLPRSSATRRIRASATRICRSCLESIRNGERCLQPCPCLFWVHYDCIIDELLTYENTHPGCYRLGCSVCLTPYNIRPQKEWIIATMERLSARYGRVCEKAFFIFIVVIFDSAITASGFSSLVKIYGPVETRLMLKSMNTVKAVSVCKTIPLLSIAINSIPWEWKLLEALRRCSKLPYLGKMFPKTDSRVKEVKQRESLVGTVVGGLLLPFFGTILGNVLFVSVGSRLHRFFLGFATFVIGKGILQIYYKQKLYSRQCNLTVEAYDAD